MFRKLHAPLFQVHNEILTKIVLRNYNSKEFSIFIFIYKELLIQYTLDLRKPDLRKNLDLRKIVATTNFSVHKLCDLRKIV